MTTRDDGVTRCCAECERLARERDALAIELTIEASKHCKDHDEVERLKSANKAWHVRVMQEKQLREYGEAENATLRALLLRWKGHINLPQRDESALIADTNAALGGEER